MLRRMSASRTAVDYVRLIEVARDSRTRHLEIVLIKSQYTVRKTQIVSLSTETGENVDFVRLSVD